MFRPEWRRHIEGFEHLWARALNSSQCFAVNLFAPLADDPRLANAFLRRMLSALPDLSGDQVGMGATGIPLLLDELDSGRMSFQNLVD